MWLSLPRNSRVATVFGLPWVTSLWDCQLISQDKDHTCTSFISSYPSSSSSALQNLWVINIFLFLWPEWLPYDFTTLTEFIISVFRSKDAPKDSPKLYIKGSALYTKRGRGLPGMDIEHSSHHNSMKQCLPPGSNDSPGPWTTFACSSLWLGFGLIEGGAQRLGSFMILTIAIIKGNSKNLV